LAALRLLGPHCFPLAPAHILPTAGAVFGDAVPDDITVTDDTVGRGSMVNAADTSDTLTAGDAVSCGCVLTVVHLLIECPLYTTVRRKYFSVLSMTELLDTIKATNILAFIREIGFYHHILWHNLIEH